MYRLLLSAGLAVALQGANAAAGELPTFELLGFPVSRHQVAVLGSANVQEQAPSPTLTWGGMPASPHQIAVLTPRQRPIEQIASSGERMATGLARSSQGVMIEQVR